jgi:hypothetical protein
MTLLNTAHSDHAATDQTRALREEAAIAPDAPHTGEVTKQTQVIAIYGKGGSGKSFALSNLSYMMAQQGKRVLLIGCDPKSDTTSLLFGGRSCPTIIETSAAKKLAGEEVRIEDVCFSATGFSRWNWAGRKWAGAVAGAASSTGSSCWKSWASTTGALTMCCSISWATWSAAALACRLRATCARR